MNELLTTPLFGIIVSLITFEIGLNLYRKTKNPICNPLLVSIILVIAILLFFDISVENYQYGGNFISFFLGPATVILAVPLYKQLPLLKENLLPIFGGITVGSITAIISVWTLGRLLGLETIITTSMIPKSVTTPIGIEISNQLGGSQPITVVSIVMTGIFGVILAPVIFRTFKIKEEIAVGIALGTGAHALGTTKAMELGETEGAMSSLSIGVAGLITVLLAPLLIMLLKI